MGYVGRSACRATTRQIRFSAFAVVITVAALAAGQAQASAGPPTISQARHVLMHIAPSSFTWNQHVGPCKRVVLPHASLIVGRTVVRCRLSENAEKVSGGHLFVGTVVQRWQVERINDHLHESLLSQRKTPLLPLHFSVTIDPNVQQSSGHDQSGDWWSADYIARAAATAGKMNLVAVRELPNGVLTFSAPGGSYVGGETSCSFRVGSGVSTQTCGIEYRHPGTYQVNVQYAPDGASPVSGTESVNIG
jgi:hypothetical protein